MTLIDRKKAFRGASEPVVLADAEQAALAEFAARRAGAAAQGPGGAALASYTSSLGRAATLRREGLSFARVAAQLAAEGRVKEGDIVLLSGFGAGLVYAGQVVTLP